MGKILREDWVVIKASGGKKSGAHAGF